MMNEKLAWFNENIEYLFHANIMEYDMVAASVSVCEKYGLLNPDKIEWLKLLPKEKRTREMGMMQKDKNFSQQLLASILDTRRKFLEYNKLSEKDIISLHSDAVIFSSKKNIISDIDGVEFRHSNTWSSYIRYKNIEMFYDDKNSVIIYKNVSKDMINLHTLGLNKYLINVFEKINNYDYSIMKDISKFQQQYLQDKLPEQFYVPFGINGAYKLDNLELLGFVTNIILKEVHHW